MRSPEWLGFRGKTLWDWLQLLIVPAILIGVTFVWSATQARSDNKREDRRIDADRAAAEEARRDATLQGYLDEMSGLMLDTKLLSSSSGSAVGVVARTVTLTTLRRLNGSRKGEVVHFLQEAGLIRNRTVEEGGTVVDMEGADLTGAALSFTQVTDANLMGADLTGAFLVRANLTGTYLFDAHLIGANLRGADLKYADLRRADLRRADLRANFSFADLRGADLRGANLSQANLSGAQLGREFNTQLAADLRGADLSHATLSHADLSTVDLRGADLKGADFTAADLTSASLGDEGNATRATDLKGAHFSGANLSSADLSGARNLDLDRFITKELRADLRTAFFDTQADFLDSLSPEELATFNLTPAKLAKFRSRAAGG